VEQGTGDEADGSKTRKQDQLAISPAVSCSTALGAQRDGTIDVREADINGAGDQLTSGAGEKTKPGDRRDVEDLIACGPLIHCSPDQTNNNEPQNQVPLGKRDLLERSGRDGTATEQLISGTGDT
jgi:hypothetical protein